MKILDKYITKNFLIGYAVAFSVLIGLRIIVDLFLNIDEFTEHADLGTFVVLKNMAIFYGLNTTLYFRDFAGTITVFAAVFSIGRMVRANELVAVMASGISLRRVICPVFVIALVLTGAFLINQELIIPHLAGKLVRPHDALPGEELYDVSFIADGKGSLIYSPRFDVKTATLYKPTILTRRRTDKPALWEVTGWIQAQEAVYAGNGKWDLVDGHFIAGDPKVSPKSYTTDITPTDIPVRRKAEHKALLAWSQLRRLAEQGTKVRDMAQLLAQIHFHVTEPIINLVMLMVALPILVCRDPKSMKSAVAASFALTAACFITTFICKMFATETVFNRVMPELWAWLPIFIFLPVVFMELDSMKS